MKTKFASCFRGGMLRTAPRLAVAVVLAGGCLVAAAPAGYASYNRSAAVTYAGNWATSRNPNYWSFDPNDCANFVSQALHAGGYSFDGYGGSQTSDYNWYYGQFYGGVGGTITLYTHSWTVVNDLDQFLANDYPGGWDWGTFPGTTSANQSGLQAGDVVIFDFGDGHGKSHMDIQVAVGNWYDWGSGWIGDQVDGHTHDRLNAYWALTPYNNQASTTTIYIDHIDTNND